MIKPTHLIGMVSILVIATGAGCSSTNPLPPITSSTPLATTTSDYVGLNDLAVSAIVQPGIIYVRNKGVLKAVTTKEYTTALSHYGVLGSRFQFVNCTGSPGTMAIKHGISFMLDNRDNKTHVITVHQNKYTLYPYNFAVITIQKTGNFTITCDGGSAAQVNVQE